MIESDVQTACSSVIRAVIARTLTTIEKIPFAIEEFLPTGDKAGTPCLSVVNFSQFGFPMTDSLVPLSELWDQLDAETTVETGIETLDLLIDEARADLYDRLLNCSPVFAPFTRVESESNATLNEVYESMLRDSQFAGNVEVESPEAEAARDFLFPRNAEGVPTVSAVLDRYKEFEAQAHELLIKVDMARNDGAAERAQALNRQLSQLNVEWGELGMKSEVESAFSIIRVADQEATFEDERQSFLEILEARKKGRLDASGSYALVTISPLSPLIDTEASSQWTEVRLNNDNTRATLDATVKALFQLSEEQVALALDHILSVRFSFTTTLLGRDWFRQDFIKSRYWRHKDRIFSDGQGGGEAPTVVTRAYFVRGITFEMGLDYSAVNSKRRPPSTGRGNRKLTVLLHTQAESRLMKQIESQMPAASANGGDIRRMAVQARFSKLIMHRNKALKASATQRRKTPHAGITPARRASPAAIRGTASRPRGVRVRPGKGVAIARPVAVQPVNAVVKPPVFSVRIGVTLSFKGVLRISERTERSDLRVTLTKFNKKKSMFEEELILTPGTEGLITFSGKAFTSSGLKGTHVVIALIANDQLLVKKAYQFGGADQAKSIDWTVRRDVIEFEMTPETIDPRLFAYALQLVPPSPNPDENLNW